MYNPRCDRGSPQTDPLKGFLAFYDFPMFVCQALALGISVWDLHGARYFMSTVNYFISVEKSCPFLLHEAVRLKQVALWHFCLLHQHNENLCFLTLMLINGRHYEISLVTWAVLSQKSMTFAKVILQRENKNFSLMSTCLQRAANPSLHSVSSLLPKTK